MLDRRMDTAAQGQLVHAHERRASARALCQRARQRMRAARRCVVESRARLDGGDRSSERTDPGEGDNVVTLPIGEARGGGERNELAVLLDFVQRRAEHVASADMTDRAHADSLLGRILWDFGTEQARALVEAALALLCPLEGSDNVVVQPEIDALRGWLERHPV
jgi:hypothetical protein